MEIYSAKQLLPLVKRHGRTVFDPGQGAVFFDWTCAGFTVTFRGSVLRGEVLAYEDRLPSPPGAPESPADTPWIGVAYEREEELARRIRCPEGRSPVTLFEGEPGLHTVRIVKLSENMRGKTGLVTLETDGELVPARAPERALSIEFVGDSITCGFGNEAPGRDDLFVTDQENGWMTYGAICGRILNAEFNMVSVSGIATAAPKFPLFPGRNMEDVYRYGDVYLDERLGQEPVPWDFSRARKDMVVINLGTNDSARMWSHSGEPEKARQEETWFSQRYRAFIRQVRKLNGPETAIVCILGPMDFYLYDKIAGAVEDYRRETEDDRVFTFKLIGVNLMTEGYGAVGHPSLKTHRRMGAELAERLAALPAPGEGGLKPL